MVTILLSPTLQTIVVSTQTQTTDVVSPSSPTELSTSRISMDVSPGETVILTLPASMATPEPTSNFVTMSSNPPTTTWTQIDLILASNGVPYSTLTTILPVATASTIPIVMTVPEQNHGWITWTASEKAGLIGGVIIVVLLLIGILICLRSKTKVWVAPNW